MHKLNCQGARALSKLLLDVYEPVGLEEYRQRMLVSIGRAIGNEVVCHNEINGPGGVSLSVLRPTVDKFEPLRAVFFEHAHEHPSLAHLIETGDSNAVKTSDFVSQNEFRRRGIYQEFYRHLRVRYQLTFGFTTHTGALGFVAVSRWHNDFTEEERSVLSLFRPHFIQAYHRAAALDQAGKNGARSCEGRTPPQLSRRELEVLHWIAEGKGNAEIAQILGVSLPTVKTHVSHLFGKLGVETRTGAFRRALDLGIIDESQGAR